LGEVADPKERQKERKSSEPVYRQKETTMFENVLWLVIVAGGPLLLAILIAWALVTRRRMGPAEQREQDRATREVYRDAS